MRVRLQRIAFLKAKRAELYNTRKKMQEQAKQQRTQVMELFARMPMDQLGEDTDLGR